MAAKLAGSTTIPSPSRVPLLEDKGIFKEIQEYRCHTDAWPLLLTPKSPYEAMS